MSSKITNYTLIAAGGALYVIGAKAFADYHENVALGKHDSFQHEHATAIGSVATLGGLGLAVFGLHGLNKTAGKVVGLGLGAVLAYNAFKHAKGEPLISLSPFAPRIGPHRAGFNPLDLIEDEHRHQHHGWGEHEHHHEHHDHWR